jgi:hypothetical protein
LSEEEQGQAKKSKDPEKPEICENPLMCPEEWEPHPGEKVLGEYHKDETAGLSTEEADLASFEKYWSSKSEGALRSEYHKEGAPLLHEPGMKPQKVMVQSQKAEPVEGPKGEEQIQGKEAAEDVKSETPMETEADRTSIERPIDIHTIEVISYAIVRALFSQGISLPIKREGIVDMELKVRGKDIIFDTKELFPITVPELVVWRVIYAYKGKPVLEIGRGVKKGLRIHKFRGILMLVDVWRGNRRLRISKKKIERAKQRGEVV